MLGVLLVCLQCSVSCGSHRHEHWTVISPTQFGDTVQEDGGHLLVLVLHKAEYFKGKASHLALAIFKDGGLGVFVTTGSERDNQHVSLERRATEI